MSKAVLNKNFIETTLKLTAKGNLAQRIFSEICTDSRQIKAGCLFIALAGDQFDGHHFVEQAIQKGATGIIVKKGFKLPANANKAACFVVKDTLHAFRLLGKAWRKKFKIPIIMVVGSVGKTTTKEYLAALLSSKYSKVLKTSESQNGFIGIPLTLLKLNSEHNAAVIEVGIDEIGAMKKHLDLVQPTAGICTVIGPEHLEKLKNIKTVAKEELLALHWLSKKRGCIALNLDDPWIAPLQKKIKGKNIFTYALQGQSGPQNLIGHYNLSESRLEVSGAGFSSLSLPCPLPGQHQARNLLGAVAVARSLNLNKNQIQSGIKKFTPAPGRTEIQKLGTHTVLCDYYNANPTSVEAALELISQLANKKRRWVCLGDMLELGKNEELFHRGLAKKILILKMEKVLLYGPRMKFLQEELMKNNFAAEHFVTQEQLAQTLLDNIRADDLILIKGSRGMKMEKVFDFLKKVLE